GQPLREARNVQLCEPGPRLEPQAVVSSPQILLQHDLGLEQLLELLAVFEQELTLVAAVVAGQLVGLPAFVQLEPLAVVEEETGPADRAGGIRVRDRRADGTPRLAVRFDQRARPALLLVGVCLAEGDERGAGLLNARQTRPFERVEAGSGHRARTPEATGLRRRRSELVGPRRDEQELDPLGALLGRESAERSGDRRPVLGGDDDRQLRLSRHGPPCGPSPPRRGSPLCSRPARRRATRSTPERAGRFAARSAATVRAARGG